MTPRTAAVGSTALVSIEDYARAGDFNVLAPVVTIQAEGATSNYLIESVSVVQINTDPRSGEVYQDYRFANAEHGQAALTSLALAKFAAAAGVKWIPDLCKVLARERRADGSVYVAYQAGAGVRATNGEWHIELATKEIDTADVAEQIEDAYLRKLRAGRAKFSDTDIPDMVRREMLQIREHGLSLAETKAKSRVIRRILSLKQVYSKQELARPFAVPRLVYRPDLTDPMAIERIQLEGARAAEQAYGALPAGTPEPPMAMGGAPLPGSNEDVPATGTVALAGSNGAAPEDGRSEGEASSKGRGRRGTNRQAAKGKGSSTTDPASPGPSEADGMPTDDPQLTGGPHKGQHLSYLVETEPAYVRSIASGEIKATAKLQTLARQWINWTHPTLGSES